MRRTFVIGCPRSGTTLVQALLARHPDVYSLQETYFFEALLGGAAARWGDRGARHSRHWYHRAGAAQSWGRRRLRELENTYWPGRRWRREPLLWRACVRRYTALLDHAADMEHKSHWVEKTPNHLLFLDEITRHVPDAHFVHVLRNGADVVASVADADLHHETTGFRGGTALWAARWNHAMSLHLAKAGDSRHHLVCLEDLVADPSAEWARLCEFTGLDADVTLLARPARTAVDSHAEPWKQGAADGIVERPVHKTRAMFGLRTLEWLDAHLTDYGEIRAAMARARGSGAPPEMIRSATPARARADRTARR